MRLAADSADCISAGWLGFFVVVLIGVATVLLIRNMNGRLKRLPTQFREDGDDSASGPTSDA